MDWERQHEKIHSVRDASWEKQWREPKSLCDRRLARISRSTAWRDDGNNHNAKMVVWNKMRWDVTFPKVGQESKPDSGLNA